MIHHLKYTVSYACTHVATVFTWLNAAAIINLVTKIDAATIQGRLLLEGGVYCTKHYYMRLLLKLTSNETEIIAVAFIQGWRLCLQL